jgi:protein-tyrosine phosphatase
VSLCAACVKHVDKIPVGTAGGCLAMTSLPGRRGKGNSGPPPFRWARSAAEDATALREVHKVDGVITLLEDEELAVYGVDGDNDVFEAYAAAGLHSLHWPVHDFSTVGHATWRKVIVEGLPLLADIRKGKCIAVHCAGGHGRTGTMVAAAHGAGRRDARAQKPQPRGKARGHYQQGAHGAR